MNHQTSSVPQIAYQSPQVSTQPITESPLVDSIFVVPVFSPGEDIIACLNKAIAFLTAVASLMQQVQGKQGQSYSGTGYKINATSSGGNNASGQAKVPPSPDYIPGPEVPPSPDYIPGPEFPPSPDFTIPVPEEAATTCFVLTSPTADSPGYVPESDPEEELEEDDDDPKEDTTAYPS
ncbi:hypothetical protein Tco_0553843 [Tanacetum coccineum]